MNLGDAILELHELESGRYFATLLWPPLGNGNGEAQWMLVSPTMPKARWLRELMARKAESLGLADVIEPPSSRRVGCKPDGRRLGPRVSRPRVSKPRRLRRG